VEYIKEIKMSKFIRKITVPIVILCGCLPLYSQEKTIKIPQKNSVIISKQPNKIQHTKNKVRKNFFLEWINTKAYAVPIDKNGEKKLLRKKWKKLLGLDIFYPYFKAKEVEDWIKDKTSMQVFKIKGRPKFENDHIKYIFKIKF